MPPAPAPRKPGPQAYSSEISLQSSRNCLVNLPSALVTVLVDNNKIAQNVIVELTFLQNQPQSPSTEQNKKPFQKSVYVGWTGLQSKRKLAAIVGRDTLTQRPGAAGAREQEVPVVEIDATFAKLVGLVDGQKVGVFLHTDPPQADTINIEPLTPADWEIIELHANFLEINLLSQIRALPNPAFRSSVSSASHPLTIHLSPTSTANVVVTGLSPAPPSSSPFAKIAPNAEVVVAPKARTKPSSSAKSAENRSLPSADGRSSSSPVRTRANRKVEVSARSPIFLRGVDRCLNEEFFDAQEDIDRNVAFKVWVDWSVLTSKELKRAAWAVISLIRPSGFQAALDPQQQQQPKDQTTMPASKIVAQVCPWEDCPDSNLVAISSPLSLALQAPLMAGETVRIEVAPAQTSRQTIKTLKILPFSTPNTKQAEGLHFGGKSKLDREDAARKILNMYGKDSLGDRILDGPITDGMILPRPSYLESDDTWNGGIIKFEPSQDSVVDEAKSPRPWLLGSDRKIEVTSDSSQSGSRLNLEVASEAISSPSTAAKWDVGEPLPLVAPSLAGADSLTKQLTTNIEYGSSVLLTGGRGSGKTSLAQLLACHFRRSEYFYTIYFPCNKFSADETRLAAIKDELSRVFGLASWGSRFGGRAMVILDDIDAICPVETELQVGNDNSRSKHISEIITSLSKQHCSTGSRIVLIATAKSKEDTNNIIIGGHVVREIININAPDKDTRRIVLEAMGSHLTPTDTESAPTDSSKLDSDAWLDGPISETSSMSGSTRANGVEHNSKAAGFTVDPSVDFLDIAGRTDGFMPGDLKLLVSRARSEALIRTVADSNNDSDNITLLSADFDAAIKGFTPASLRNVTLQHSSITFSSIGGLYATRQTLLETLQYPTLYAPIFARSPLRLRSGLLLYGYPGCGKTLLASAVAGECGLNFISVKGPEILNKYIGASEKAVRDLFERAQAARPCVLFFDEFDSIAPKRGHDSTGVTDRVVNQMLTQMDGAEGLSGVYVLAATSRPDLIDPALLRPGRLDKSLLCDMPTYDERHDILQALSKKLKLKPSILNNSNENKSQTLAEVASRTEGYSGADLQAMIYNAHLDAIHDALKDHSRPSSKSSRPSTATDSAPYLANGSSKSLPDFTFFRFGKEENSHENGSGAISVAAQATERSQIVAQLASHRATQQRARMARHALASGNTDGRSRFESQAAHEKKQDQEPVISWEHIERALTQTRPSISQEERRRLASIYREFVVGRNGEMPSGQGSNEIGGRSSLM